MTANLITEARALQETLGLKWPPISITFTNNRPNGIVHIDQRAPSGCTYWKLAAEGNVFYTEASDHYGCPIGAHTHGIELPPIERTEMERMIEMMVGLSYLRLEEVPNIPQREDPFRFAVYAPLANTPLAPDVVVVRGNAKQMMVIAEAANVAGVSNSSGIMGRPTCAIIAAAMKTQQSVMSLGCIGNRVYNEMGDEELYIGISAKSMITILHKLSAIAAANSKLEEFHLARKDSAPPKSR